MTRLFLVCYLFVDYLVPIPFDMNILLQVNKAQFQSIPEFQNIVTIYYILLHVPVRMVLNLSYHHQSNNEIKLYFY